MHNSAPINFHLFLRFHSWNLESSLEVLSRNHFKLENDNVLLMKIMNQAMWKIEKEHWAGNQIA